MKPAIVVAFVLTLGLAACSSSEEPSATAAAKPAAPAAAAADGEAGTQGRIMEASQLAFQQAEKACAGCPNPQACQEALGSALRLTTLALQSYSEPTESLETSQAHAEHLTKQFDGLAKLSNECLKDEG
ncbi:MAG: hypothetical protein P8R42_01515 [Candidatus Binatia bacterium]|nr:hypothetical protein [Candidatus Binatia bacterium]